MSLLGPSWASPPLARGSDTLAHVVMICSGQIIDKVATDVLTSAASSTSFSIQPRHPAMAFAADIDVSSAAFRTLLLGLLALPIGLLLLTSSRCGELAHT